MNALKSLSRALMTFAMIAGLMLGASLFTPSASAAGYARITLHVFECGAKGGNLYDQCHNAKHALEGAPFRVAGVTRLTDANGHVTWAPGAGFHTVRGSAPAAYYESYVYCSNQVTGKVLYNGLSGGDDAVSFTTTAGQQVICDWYYLF
jgi:hypothetical protein